MLLRTFVLSVIFLGYMIFYAESRGVLTIRLLNFENKKGRTYDGSCCDHTALDNASCPDQCDYVMRLIISGLGRANDHVFLFHRPLKYDANDISFQEEATDMVLTILFDEWPKMGHVKMNAFFYDYDDYDHTTLLVDWFENELTRTVNKGNYQRSVVKGNRQSDKTSLEFEWSVHCFTANDCLKPPPEWKSWPWDQKEQHTLSGISFPKSTSEETPTRTSTMEILKDVVAHQWNNGKWKMSSVAPGKQVILDSPAIVGSDRRRKSDVSTKIPTGYADKTLASAAGFISHTSSFSSKSRNDQSSYFKKSPFINSGFRKNTAVFPTPSVKTKGRGAVADITMGVMLHTTGIRNSSTVKTNEELGLTKRTDHKKSPFTGKEEKTSKSTKPKLQHALLSTTGAYKSDRTRTKVSRSKSKVLKNTPWTSSTLTLQWLHPQSTINIRQQQTSARYGALDMPSPTSPTIPSKLYNRKSPTMTTIEDPANTKSKKRTTFQGWATVSAIKSDLPSPESSHNMKTSTIKITSRKYTAIRDDIGLSSRTYIASTVTPIIQNTPHVSRVTPSNSGMSPTDRLGGRKKKNFGGTLKSRYQLMHADTHLSRSNGKTLTTSPTDKGDQQSKMRHKADQTVALQTAKTYNKILSVDNKRGDRHTMKPFQPESRSISNLWTDKSTNASYPSQFKTVTKNIRKHKGHNSEIKHHTSKVSHEQLLHSPSTRNQHQRTTLKLVSKVDTPKSPFSKRIFPKATFVKVTTTNQKLPSVKMPSKKLYNKGIPSQSTSLTLSQNKNSSKNNMAKDFKNFIQTNIRKYVSSITRPPALTVLVNDKVAATHSNLKSSPKSFTKDEQWWNRKLTSAGRQPVSTTPAGPAWTHFTRWWQRPQTTPALPTVKVLPAGANEGKVYNIVDGFKRRKEREKVKNKQHSPFKKIQKNNRINNIDGSRSNADMNSRRGRIITPTHATTTRQTPSNQVTTHSPGNGKRWVWHKPKTLAITTADPHLLKPKPSQKYHEVDKTNGLYTLVPIPILKTDVGSEGISAPGKATSTRGWNQYTKNTNPINKVTHSYQYIQISTSNYRKGKERGWKPQKKSSKKTAFTPERKEHKTPEAKHSTPIPQTKKWRKYSTARIPRRDKYSTSSTPQATRQGRYSPTPTPLTMKYTTTPTPDTKYPEVPNPVTTRWGKRSSRIPQASSFGKFSGTPFSKTNWGKYSTTVTPQATKWNKLSATRTPNTVISEISLVEHSTTRSPRSMWGKYSKSHIPQTTRFSHDTATRIPQTRLIKYLTTPSPEATKRGKYTTLRTSERRWGKYTTPRTSERRWGKYTTPRTSERRWGKYTTPRTSERRWGKYTTPRTSERRWGKYSTTPTSKTIKWGKHSTTRVTQARWGKYSTTHTPKTTRWGKYTTNTPKTKWGKYTTNTPKTKWGKQSTHDIPQTSWGKHSTTPQKTRWGQRKIRTTVTVEPSTSLTQDARTKYTTKHQYSKTTKWSKWLPQTSMTTQSSTYARRNYHEKISYGKSNNRFTYVQTTPPSDKVSPKTTKIWHYITKNINLPPAQTTNIWQGLMSTRVITSRRTIDMGTQPTQKTPVDFKKIPKLNRWNESKHKKEKRPVHMSKTGQQIPSNIQNSNRRVSSSTRNVVTPVLEAGMQHSAALSGLQADMSKTVTRWWRKSPADGSSAQPSSKTANTTFQNRKVTQHSPEVEMSTRWWERRGKERKQTTVQMSESTTVIDTNHKGKVTTHIQKPTRWWQRKRPTTPLPSFQSTTSRAVKLVTPLKVSVITRWWQRRKGEKTFSTQTTNRQEGLPTARRFTKSDLIQLRPTKWWQRPTPTQRMTATRSVEIMNKDLTQNTVTRPTVLGTRSWMKANSKYVRNKQFLTPLSSSVHMEQSSNVVSKEQPGLFKSVPQKNAPFSEQVTSGTKWWERRRKTPGAEANKKTKTATLIYHPTTITTSHNQQTTNRNWPDKQGWGTSTRHVTYSRNTKSKHMSTKPAIVMATTMWVTKQDKNQNNDVILTEKAESRRGKKTKTWNIFEFLPDVLNKMYSGKSIHETDYREDKISVTSTTTSTKRSLTPKHETVTVKSAISKTLHSPARRKSSMSKSRRGSSTLRNLRITTPRKLNNGSKNRKSKNTAVTVPSNLSITKIARQPTTKIYSGKSKKTVTKQYHLTTTATTQIKNTFGAKSEVTKDKNQVNDLSTTLRGTMYSTRRKTRNPRILSTTATTHVKPGSRKVTPKYRDVSLSHINTRQGIDLSQRKVTKQPQIKLKATLLGNVLQTSKKHFPANPGSRRQPNRKSSNEAKTTESERRKKPEKVDRITKQMKTRSNTTTKKMMVTRSNTTTKKMMVTRSNTTTKKQMIVRSNTKTKKQMTTRSNTTTKKPTVTRSNTTTKKSMIIRRNTTTKKQMTTRSNTTTKKPMIIRSNTTTKKQMTTRSNTTTKKPMIIRSNTTTKKPMIIRSNTTTRRTGQTLTTMKTTQKNETIRNRIRINTHRKNTTKMKTVEKTAKINTTPKSTEAAKSDLSITPLIVKTGRKRQTSMKTTTLKAARKTTIKYKDVDTKSKTTTIKPNLVETKHNKITAVGSKKRIQKNRKEAKQVTKTTGISVNIKKVTVKKTGIKTNGIKTDFIQPGFESNDNKIQLNSIQAVPKPTVPAVNTSSDRGPRVIVPNDGLFVPGPGPTKIVKIVTAQRDENGTMREEEVFVAIPSNSEAQHIGLQVKRLNIQTVFNRYWPAILGLTIGTAFLVAAILTSVACRAQRLYIQRYRYNDQPQHLTEPPDTSEYSSSAASLVSDATRSSIRL